MVEIFARSGQRNLLLITYYLYLLLITYYLLLIFANSGFLNFARFIFANIWMNRISRVLFSYL